jgi:hypothetical protein
MRAERSNASRQLRAIIHRMQRFAVTIEGVGWTDVQVLELPRLPREGELIETKYGTCRVTHSELTANTEPFDGKVVCSNS